MVQQHKTCTKCGETKPLDGFRKGKREKYGVQSYCKPCQSEYGRRYREENRDEIAERERRYREANREKELERSRRYHEENRDEILEQKRHYREENREIVNAKSRKILSEEQSLTKTFATTPLHTRYLPGEDALILADNGMTIYQKAIELGRTHASVKDRRHRLLAKGGVSNDTANA